MWYVTIGLIVILAFIFAGIYNSLVNKRNKVKNSWSQIEIQLKRRFDLIPNLVETVRGYAEHEKSTFNQVAELRTKFMNSSTPADMMKTNSEMTQVLGKLFAVSESYPELKANTNFLELQTQLSDTENKISFSRQFYNDVVMDLNNSVQMFPTNIVALMFGFKEEEFFKAEEHETKNVSVKF